MSKRKQKGKRLLRFELFGNRWTVRETGKNSGAMDPDSWGECHFDARIVWLQDERSATKEQRKTTLLHEVQHIIEEHFCLDFTRGGRSAKMADNYTDRISLGWLYVIRGCPEILTFVK